MQARHQFLVQPVKRVGQLGRSPSYRHPKEAIKVAGLKTIMTSFWRTMGLGPIGLDSGWSGKPKLLFYIARVVENPANVTRKAQYFLTIFFCNLQIWPPGGTLVMFSVSCLDGILVQLDVGEILFLPLTKHDRTSNVEKCNMQNRGSLLGFRNEASTGGGESMGRGKAQTEEPGNDGAGRSLMAAGVLILRDGRWHGILAASFERHAACFLQASRSSLFSVHASTPAVTTVASLAFLDVRIPVLKNLERDSKKSCNVWPEIPNILSRGFCVAC